MKEMNQSLCIVGKEIWNANIGEMMRIMTLQEAYSYGAAREQETNTKDNI